MAVVLVSVAPTVVGIALIVAGWRRRDRWMVPNAVLGVALIVGNVAAVFYILATFRLPDDRPRPRPPRGGPWAIAGSAARGSSESEADESKPER